VNDFPPARRESSLNTLYAIDFGGVNNEAQTHENWNHNPIKHI
jgi:hypothetical protein